MSSATMVSAPVLDTWMAMVAGGRVWHHEADDVPSPLARAIAGLMVSALGALVFVQLAVLATRAHQIGVASSSVRGLEWLALVGMIAAVVLAVRPTRLVLGHRLGPANFWWSIGWRSTAYLAMIVVSAAMLTRWRVIAAAPFGVAFGTDATLTMWTLGLSPTPIRWAKRMAMSTIHFGAVGALVGSAVFDPDGPSLGTVLGLYLAMVAAVVIASGTVWMINALHGLINTELTEERHEPSRRERRRLVHWMHDDVLSEVKLTALRVESLNESDVVRRELLDLDHRLRLRQLDETLRSGSPRLYELIQPHLRRAQSLGIRLERVPKLEQSDVIVDEETGLLIHRALSVLMSNATNAGARHLSLVVQHHVDPPGLTLSVADDAGGFSLDDLPPGRGLALLERDIGPGSLSRTDVPNGSIVSVRIPVMPASTGQGIDHR